MMSYQNLFERTEKKYLVTAAQQAALLKIVGSRLQEDKYARSTILSLYFDTDDYRMIRASVEEPIYKEKLRLRSYGVPKDDTTVFLELKKKYKSVVYKRREGMTLTDARAFIDTGKGAKDSQITKEIEWQFRFYPNLQPRVLISYDRLALVGTEERDLRITFDSNILYRDYDLDLASGIGGERILDVGMRVMEIKALDAMPLWLCDTLDMLKIYPASFSKYGTAYTRMHENKFFIKGADHCA
ncbi:MAG: polyphosphate polymerase domain-containing protein [Clostridia bacterium]|nr:polyphosphate polymerase domain-containing protein [Clostridia bacterium]